MTTDDLDYSELSKAQLEQLQNTVRAELKRRYPRRKGPRYGRSVDRAFKDHELPRFFGALRTEKWALFFTIMRDTGARVGEVCPVHTDDLNLEDATCTVLTEKAGTIDHLYLTPLLVRWFRSWIHRYGRGYLFPSQEGSTRPYTSPTIASRRFRQACTRADLDRTYGTRNGTGRQGGRLHKLTTHSFRHRYGYLIRTTTKDPEITRALLRQRHLSSTEIYAQARAPELHAAVRHAIATPCHAVSATVVTEAPSSTYRARPIGTCGPIRSSPALA